jgi:hypothetical protein
MIPKSGNRFSEKIMLNQKAAADICRQERNCGQAAHARDAYKTATPSAQ